MGADVSEGDSDNDPAAMSPRLEKSDAVTTALIMGEINPGMTDKHALTISPATALTGVQATKVLVEATMDTAGGRTYKLLTTGEEIVYVGVTPPSSINAPPQFRLLREVGVVLRRRKRGSWRVSRGSNVVRRNSRDTNGDMLLNVFAGGFRGNDKFAVWMERQRSDMDENIGVYCREFLRTRRRRCVLSSGE